MNNNIVSLDFFNSNFFIRVEGTEYYWQDLNKFVEDTDYPFAETTAYVSYEPLRDIYHVERKNSRELTTGLDQPEIQWFIERIGLLKERIQYLIELDKPVITGFMQRAQYLYDTDWLVQRHQEEVLRGVPTTLSEQHMTALLNYKQELRDLTLHCDLNQPAETINWPFKP